MVLQDAPVDYIVKGEGEVTFTELINALGTGREIRSISGLVFKDNIGDIVETPDREFIGDLDSIPFPAYDLLQIGDYFKDPHFHGGLNKYNLVLPILTSRGCPFKCSFCYHAMGYTFRPRSPQNVVAEIDWLVKDFGIREIQIEDDTFNFKIERAKEIMHLLSQRDYKLSIVFPSGLKFNMIDEELMDLFKKVGVYRIHYGIETAVPRIQQLINKPINREKLDRVIELTDKANISSHGFFIIGFPTETEDEIQQTIDYASKSRLATANFSILKLFPGTLLGDKYLKKTEKFEDDFSFSYDAVTDNLSCVSDDRLKELQKSAMTSFYFRPSRLWRIFRTTPNKKQLFTRNLAIVSSLIFKGKTKY
ncbi:MAG: radical SAM protein [Nitrospirae bacterium]|nr:radical SAM protein [Nitrospirota bacterium]